MSKRTTLLGTAFVLTAGLGAGPAAADTLDGFSGVADANYMHQTTSGCHDCTLNGASLGLVVGMPLADIPNLNWQMGGEYTHEWTPSFNHFGGYCSRHCSHEDSAEEWNFDFDVFWAGPQSRFGANGHYDTVTHLGHVTNGGIFGEWYFNDMVTVMAKGGYIWTGGANIGGHGAQFGVGAVFYALTDLAITPDFQWVDIVSGNACRVCGRNDFGAHEFGLMAEYLVNEQWPFAVYGKFAYTQDSISGPGNDGHSITWLIGIHWYFTGGGTLVDHQRNGNLNPFLTTTFSNAAPIGF